MGVLHIQLAIEDLLDLTEAVGVHIYRPPCSLLWTVVRDRGEDRCQPCYSQAMISLEVSEPEAQEDMQACSAFGNSPAELVQFPQILTRTAGAV